MIEVGNSPDFSCGDDAAALARCQAHMTMWSIMKSPLILGNDIPNETPATLGVLANKEAIGVSQDAWGIQARRVAVQAPRNTSISASAFDNIAIVAPCDAAELRRQQPRERLFAGGPQRRLCTCRKRRFAELEQPSRR